MRTKPSWDSVRKRCWPWGGVRPDAILVPQRAVQQSGQGHFVWLVDQQGQAERRPVEVGDWYEDNWFINEGLHAGEQLVVDGGQRLTPGAKVVVTARAAAPPAAGASAVRVPPAASAASR